MIHQAIHKVLKREILGRAPSDLEAMMARIEDYRRKGAKIGNDARLIGRLDGLNPHLVTIGDNCVIAAASALLTHCTIPGARPVVIADEVWIGYNALILPGVRLGAQSVIGAGAVTTSNVPRRSFAAGNPVRALRCVTDEELASLTKKLRPFMCIGESSIRGGRDGDALPSATLMPRAVLRWCLAGGCFPATCYGVVRLAPTGGWATFAAKVLTLGIVYVLIGWYTLFDKDLRHAVRANILRMGRSLGVGRPCIPWA